MAMQWYEFGNDTYALIGGSNIGFIVQGGRSVIIDTGLDRDAAKKALRAVDDLGARPAAILITHGHTDHFGGAAWLAKRAGIPIYAPPLEAVFVAHPILEPLFLYGGAAPIKELQGKFTLAKQSAPVSGTLAPGAQEIAGFSLNIIALPGHALEQIGVVADSTVYCGDAIFPEDTLARHPILFCADIDLWLETLETLPTLGYNWVVPGHGEPAQDIVPLVEANAARLFEIRTLVWEALAEPKEPQAVLRAVADHYGVVFTVPPFFLLALTTIQSALTSLQRAGEAEIVMQANNMLWRRC